MTKRRRKARLLFQDGSFFEGFLFGSPCSVSGEAVFQTGMVGYPEAMTDPSYFGQILVFTYPLIGNYGVPSLKKNEEGLFLNFESGRIQPKGIVVASYSDEFSHWQAQRSLEDWMKEEGIPGITGVDTRAITQKLREKGSLLAKIVVQSSKTDWYDPNKENVLPEVSCGEPVEYGSGKLRVLLIDCGAKEGILRSLLKRSVSVVRLPFSADVSKYSYDGILVSNGPGDPKQAREPIETLKKLFKQSVPKPIFGVCLGIQLMALASGADTEKLPFGHRSQNQPCQDLETKRCYVTSQNHGFAVSEKSLSKEWRLWFRNINDGTVEGIRHKSKPFFAVQFHPEASPGPQDTDFLFDYFIDLCRK